MQNMGNYPYLAAIKWFKDNPDGNGSILTTDYTILYADNWRHAIGIIEDYYGTDLDSIIELKRYEEGLVFFSKEAYEALQQSLEEGEAN